MARTGAKPAPLDAAATLFTLAAVFRKTEAQAKPSIGSS